jgi:hypothetical protein
MKEMKWFLLMSKFSNYFIGLPFTAPLYSDDHLFRAYGELSDKLPSLKHLLDQQEDPELLELFYKNVQ